MANLQRIETSLPGVVELRPRIFRDARGLFLETYNCNAFADLGIRDTFVQDNHSWSNKGVLRGLHYQLRHAQTKLCRVVQGQALDIAVDIRRGSPHFGKWTALRLSAELQNQIYIPAGFAHGFLALTDPVQFLYKCTNFYHAGDEFGVLWNDPFLNIPWEIGNPNVSEKDLKLPQLHSIPAEQLPQYPET
jgi:dTDP-4-dehydrorhamnose 3,5-epimerase